MGDLADLQGLRATIQRIAPDIIVNAAAYTAVDKAESDKDLTLQINTTAVQVISEEAKSWAAGLCTFPRITCSMELARRPGRKTTWYLRSTTMA